MKVVNIANAKANLSGLLEEVAAGATILIANRNRPVAELRPVPVPRSRPRPVGLAAGLVMVPPSFFDPLAEADLQAFERSSWPSPKPGADHVAESPATSRPPRNAPARSTGRRRSSRR